VVGDLVGRVAIVTGLEDHGSRISELHHRYRVQAGWTSAIRERLYAVCNLENASHVLEVGSGTGVVISELSSRFRCKTYGVDIDRAANAFASVRDLQTSYVTGDGARLPFRQAAFDVVLCHFLFLWVRDAAGVISEMKRVTRPGGSVLALAEPDYGGRIDYPPELAEIGALQTQALASQGTDPHVGRKLRDIFSRAGLFEVQVGVLGGEWTGPPPTEELESEWRAFASDVEDTLSKETLETWRAADLEAWTDGSRILYVPTFYARGRVPIPAR
jgi:ubiquinone/menaquinone biosynthesis C-methylase UbiE